MMRRLAELAADDHGATLVEYGMIIGLIACVSLAVLAAIGNSVHGIFTKVNDTFNKAAS